MNLKSISHQIMFYAANKRTVIEKRKKLKIIMFLWKHILTTADMAK